MFTHTEYNQVITIVSSSLIVHIPMLTEHGHILEQSNFGADWHNTHKEYAASSLPSTVRHLPQADWTEYMASNLPSTVRKSILQCNISGTYHGQTWLEYVASSLPVTL